MADTPEALASQLDQFVGDAIKKVPPASFLLFGTTRNMVESFHQVGVRPKIPTVKDVYADCLRQLTDQEREVFARTLARMRTAL